MRNKARTRVSRLDLRSVSRDYLLLTIGGLLLAANLNLFLAPSNIAPGGVSGTAIIINEFTRWPIGLTMLILNIPLVILGFRYLGRFRFLVRTLYVVFLYNLGVDLLARWVPPGGITDDLLLNALYGGVVGGIGTGLVYRGGGTTGGTGILGRVLQMKTGIPVSQIYIVTDGGVILVAGVVFGWERGLYALMTLFVWGLAADYVLEGPSVVRTAFIVTDRPQAVARAILSNLRLGVTAWPAWGMFTESEHTVLFCTVSRPYEGALRSVVAEADPDAFIAIGHGHQASGGVFGQTLFNAGMQAQGQGRNRKPNRDASTSTRAISQCGEIRELISRYYEIGELKDCKQLDRGYVNISYIIETIISGRTEKYFLRKYKKGVREAEIEFEHSIINHLAKKDFGLVARVISTTDGKTYVKRCEDEESVFYAIFDFLPGEDKYTWDNPDCNNQELRNAAAVLAQFHNTVFDLNPAGKRYEPEIIHLLPRIAENARKYAKRAGNTEFDAYFLENLGSILATIERTLRAIDEREYEEIVHQVIHCDYHPGNLKFQNGEITGLFDFDWAKIDARCFDVALAVMYFCTAWKGERDGDFELDKAAVFLNAYQNTLGRGPGAGPLNDVELKYLPHMINASNIYVLNWALEDFYGKEVNPYEYLRYLQHNVNLIRWLEDKGNWDRLERMIVEASQEAL